VIANLTLHARGSLKCNRTLHDEFRSRLSIRSRTRWERVPPLLLFRSALASPPRILFDLAGVFSFLIWYGGGGRGRVSPKEKLTEF